MPFVTLSYLKEVIKYLKIDVTEDFQVLRFRYDLLILSTTISVLMGFNIMFQMVTPTG